MITLFALNSKLQKMTRNPTKAYLAYHLTFPIFQPQPHVGVLVPVAFGSQKLATNGSNSGTKNWAGQEKAGHRGALTQRCTKIQGDWSN